MTSFYFIDIIYKLDVYDVLSELGTSALLLYLL